MDTKRCKRCGEIRVLSEFYKDRSRKDGFGPYCKQCIRERADWKNPTQRQTRKECNRRLYKYSDKYRKMFYLMVKYIEKRIRNILRNIVLLRSLKKVFVGATKREWSLVNNMNILR